MTIFVQYYKNGGYQSQPPPPTVTVGQTIGARLVVHNDHPDGQTKTFTARKKLLNPSGGQAAYQEESQVLGYGKVGFFPITTSNTPQAGNYSGDFQVYIGSSLWATWQGNQNVSPAKLLAVVKDTQVIPTPDPDGDDGGSPTPPPDGSVTPDYYVKIGEASFDNVEQLSNYSFWDGKFKSGDCGIAKIKIGVPLIADVPNWLAIMLNPFGYLTKQYPYELTKAGIADYYNSYLPAKGVKLWKPCYWEGSYLCVPFQVGIAALVILAIALGVALIIAAVLTPIALWKVGVAYVNAQKETELEGQDQILKAISNINDPELQAKVLLDYLGMKAAGESNESIWEKLFEKPVMIVGITISVCLVAFLVIKMVRR